MLGCASAWIDLHVLAVGGAWPLDGRDGGSDAIRFRGNFGENNDRVAAAYDVRDKHGKILLQLGRGRIGALDFPVPGSEPRQTALREKL